MHFVHILSYTWENGGASKVVFDLAKFQVENGDQSTIITMDMSGQKRYKHIEGVQFISVKPHFLTRFFPLFSFELWSILKRNIEEFDIIHLHGLWNFTLLASHLLGLHQKSIVTIHGCAHPYTFISNRIKRGLFTYGFQRNFLKKVRMIHVLHLGELEEVEEYIGDKKANIRIIPNGIDVPEISINRHKKDNKVLFLSRLHQKKGLDLLLPAFKKAMVEVPDAQLIIAGPNFGMLDFVRDFISKNNLGNSIKYIGTVDGQAKIDLLLSSKVFALPSYSEGFSIAVLEALVYQIPVVVSTETGLSAEIEESEAGIVIELNPDSVSKAIVDLLKNSEKGEIMAQNGRNLVIERFETSKVCGLFDRNVKELFRSF
jgi:glycosyltransferase involved in cell wall biosynthesis